MIVHAPTRGRVGSFCYAHVLHYLRWDLRFEPVEDKFCRAVRQQHTNTSFKILISSCIWRLLQESPVGSVLFVDQVLVQLKHVELEYLSLLMSAADRILGGSNECSGIDYIFGTRESRSSLRFLKRGRSSGAISSSDCCRIWWNIGGVHGRWAGGGSVDGRCQTNLIWFDIIWSDIKSGVIWSDQIISNFIMCLASALPSAGGSNFDNSALIDANFERMRGFAPARHLISFDITP